MDEFDSPLEPLPRHVVFKNGHWRRTAHVWIINDQKQVLVQRRSLKKDMSPGKWEASIGGHLSPGDNYFTGAAREVREETGLPITEKDLTLVKIYKDHNTNEYRGIFYCNWNPNLDEMEIEKDEVDEVKLLHIKTLEKHLIHQKSDNWVIPGYEREMISALS